MVSVQKATFPVQNQTTVTSIAPSPKPKSGEQLQFTNSRVIWPPYKLHSGMLVVSDIKQAHSCGWKLIKIKWCVIIRKHHVAENLLSKIKFVKVHVTPEPIVLKYFRNNRQH